MIPIPEDKPWIQTRPCFDVGSLSVLNCGMGDLKISFNSKDPADVEKARNMVIKLLEQGCLIIVKDKLGRERRVKRFDPKRDEYIVKDYPHVGASEVSEKDAGSKEGAAKDSAPRKGKRSSERIPAKSTAATAIAPRSGG